MVLTTKGLLTMVSTEEDPLTVDYEDLLTTDGDLLTEDLLAVEERLFSKDLLTVDGELSTEDLLTVDGELSKEYLLITGESESGDLILDLLTEDGEQLKKELLIGTCNMLIEKVLTEAASQLGTRNHRSQNHASIRRTSNSNTRV